MAGVIGADQFLRGRRERTHEWIAWAVITGSIIAGAFAFRLVYFGEPLPNTFYAKVGGTWVQWQRGFNYLADYAADHEGLALFLAPLVVFLAASAPLPRLLAIGACALLLAVVWEGGDGLPMYRTVVPALPLLYTLQGELFRWAAQTAASQLGRAPRQLAPAGAIVVGALVAANVTPPQTGFHYGDYLYQQTVEVPRWTRVGLWVRDHAKSGDSFAAVPIGAVSFYSGLRAYDMLGLTDRHIAHVAMPDMGSGIAGHEKHDGQYILGQRPTYLLLGNIDVTTAPRNPQARPFIPYSSRYVLERERDMYATPLLLQMYRPRSELIAPGQYLNFYELKEEFRP